MLAAFVLPAGESLSMCPTGRTVGRTDGRTDTRPMHHALTARRGQRNESAVFLGAISGASLAPVDGSLLSCNKESSDMRGSFRGHVTSTR